MVSVFIHLSTKSHTDHHDSFPFGWLFLPVDLIGHPFSQKTRDHFLPLLTSTTWWSETQHALRKVFMKDSDFQERMFARQMAVMKGQAWNVAETLKMPDHGPLELTRRAKVCVWDDLVDVPIAVPMRASPADARAAIAAARSPRPRMSLDEVDIGASVATVPKDGLDGLGGETRDLLGPPSPPAEMPSSNRFVRQFDENDSGSSSSANNHSNNNRNKVNRSRPIRHDTTSSSFPFPSSTATSHLSHATDTGRSIAQRLHDSAANVAGDHVPDLDADEFDGDLGYAAAQDMECHRRKVIVERLEAVKTRNPVFTCW